MGLISRHSGAPFANGETLSGSDLEQDFSTIYDEFNGSIDNANIASGANIAGSKLATNSIPNSKLISETITLDKMAAATVPKHHVDTIASYGSLETGNATLVDWTGLSSASLTPGSVNDTIFMDLTFHYSAASDDLSNDIVIGWSVDGTDYDSVIASTPVADRNDVVVHSIYAVTAPDTDSMVIKPRQRYNGSETLTVGHVTFRCFILPGK